MEISRENIKKTIKLLKKIPYNPTEKNKCYIFFPLEGKTTKEDGMFLDVKASKGSAALLKSGLILEKGCDGTAVKLAYVQTDYCPKFYLDDYLDLQDHKLSKKDIEEICSYECLIVRGEYLVGSFEY